MAAIAADAQNNGYYIDFNGSVADLTGNFIKPYDLGPISDFLTWGEDVGVGGSGGLNVIPQTQNRSMYYKSTFDLLNLPVGQVITSTTDFLWGNSTATSTTHISVGFTSDPAAHGIVGRDTATSGRILRNNSNEVGLYFREGQENKGSLTFSQDELEAGNWYRLSFVLTKVGEEAYNYEVALYTLGASGLEPPQLFTFGEDNTPALISGAVGAVGIANLNKEELYFGYISRNDNGNGISNLDNFMVFVPEPGAYGIFAGLITLGLVVLRRLKAA